jgi:serine/threonine protein kinase
MEKLIGQRFSDRYQIESLLGRQTGRRTYLAKDLQTELPVVIKLLLFSPDFTWEDLKLFEREAETLKSLDHSAIPRYLDFFEVETELGRGFALVQSYIEARSLRAWVQCGCTFSEAELKEIALQLLKVLEYLHTRQPPVIHRDIKPSNILLKNRSGNSPGQVYLVDFGSVQTVARGGTVTVVGTYGYMPPEQFGGRSLPASDLFSVGATLIYLATGQDPADLPQKDLQIEFEPLATLSYPFTRWLQWLTQPNPAQRPASAQKALQPLAQGLYDSLPMQRSRTPLSVGVRQLRSNLQLKKTPTSFELIIPASKIKSPKNLNKSQSNDSCLLLILISLCCCFFMRALIFLLSWVGVFVGFLLWMVSVSIYLIVRQPFKTCQTYPSSYKLILKSDDGSITLNLFPILPDKALTSSSQCTGKLHHLYAGHGDIPMYCLGFYCGDQSLHIQGSRSEIRCLCDELNEWTGLEVKYRDYSPPGV